VEVSIVIRTLNEAEWLGDALAAVAGQEMDDRSVEVIIVDSGSTDATLEIAKKFGARIVTINKAEFTFGRSLNVGCEAARGRIIAIISGHCIPASKKWLSNLIAPLGADGIVYTYGKQVGHERSKYSEHRLFKKYFPDASNLPQKGFFCNNANSAILRDTWADNKFDEELTGLEDMEIGKRLVNFGQKIGYVADAPVVHIHEESWQKVRIRYEREAIALQAIMPEIHVSLLDFVRYASHGIALDIVAAFKDKRLLKEFYSIVMFRTMQFWGTYCGNNDHRNMSRARKESYFYPR
jgi:rhamnosyltransferase